MFRTSISHRHACVILEAIRELNDKINHRLDDRENKMNEKFGETNKKFTNAINALGENTKYMVGKFDLISEKFEEDKEDMKKNFESLREKSKENREEINNKLTVLETNINLLQKLLRSR